MRAEFYPKKQREPAPPELNDLTKGGVLGHSLGTTVDNIPVNEAKTHAISSNWAYEHGQEQEESLYAYGQVLRSILYSLWGDVDWDNVDLNEIDWEEWLEPVVLEENLRTTQFAKAMVMIDLSGGAVSNIPILHTSQSCTLQRISIIYTEASSADTGVTIEVGKESDTDYYYTGLSEVNKAIWYELDVPLQKIIPAGDTLTCGSVCGKIGTGEVLVCVEYKVN